MASVDRSKESSVNTGESQKPKELFGLPRAIARELRKCAQAGSPDKIKYLWINVDKDCSEGSCPEAVELNDEEWLDVVDEAVSLGAQAMVICIGESFHRYPFVWRITRWAQDVHGLRVGFHTYAASIDNATVEQFTALNPDKTWVFVSAAHVPVMEPLRALGVHIGVADADHGAHELPCNGPKSLLFVGPEGVLYSCALVLGNEAFTLGHALDKPLGQVVEDADKPRAVLAGTRRSHHGCAACPNRMFAPDGESGHGHEHH